MTDLPLETPPRPPRWFLPVVGTSIVVMIAATNIGNIVWPCAVALPGADSTSSVCTAPVLSWFDGNPLGLLMLNSSNKYLLATSVLTEGAVRRSHWSGSCCPTRSSARLRLRGKALNWAPVFPSMDPVFDQFESQGGAPAVLDVAVVVAPNNPSPCSPGRAMPWRRFPLNIWARSAGSP
jgi:hypothetical protein